MYVTYGSNGDSRYLRSDFSSSLHGSERDVVVAVLYQISQSVVPSGSISYLHVPRCSNQATPPSTVGVGDDVSFHGCATLCPVESNGGGCGYNFMDNRSLCK